MLRWIVRLLLNGGALLLISQLFPAITVDSYPLAVLAALILGLVNTVIRPILTLFTLPLKWMTLGLFHFVINAITFAMTAYLIDGFELGAWPDSVMSTLLAAALMSLFGWVIERVVRKKKE